MGDPYLPLREDARGGVVLASRCCGFLAEAGGLRDAEFLRRCFMLRPADGRDCPLCGKGRPGEGKGCV